MAKKKSPIGSVLVVLAVIVVAYFAYRLVFGRKVSAAGNGAYSGGGAYGSGSPYQYGQQTSSTGSNALLNALAKLLGGQKQSSSKPSQSNSQDKSQSKPSADKSAAQYQQGSGIADIYNSIVEGLIPSGPDAGQLQGSESNQDLGGDSLYSYEPDVATQSGLGDYQIPYESYDASQYDLPLYGYDSPDYGSGGSGGGGYDASQYADVLNYSGDFQLADSYSED